MSNLVPEGWSKYLLQDVCYFQEGPGLRRWQYTIKGYPFINIRCIKQGALDLSNVQYISETEALEKYQHFFLNEGDLVLSSSGTLGRMAKVKKSDLPIMLNTSVIRFKSTNEKQLYPTYLPHLLQSSEFVDQITEESQGSAQVNFGPTHLKLVSCCFPPLPEQQKIAAILTSVDDVIEKTQAQIDKLKDLKSGMMQELLTKGVGIKQGDKYEPHIEFKDSPVGRIPKSWEVQPIADLCSHVVDCVNKTAPVVDFKTPYKMIRTTNVRHGRVDTENVRCVSKETYENWTRRIKPENGDLIFTREAPVGECGILEDSRGIFLGQRTMMYRANEKKTSSGFLMYSLMSEYGRKQLENFSGGSTVPHMRVPDCGKILIKTPPLNEQNKILGSLNSVDFSILQKEKKLAKLLNLKKALMQDLLTGKVRVKVDNDLIS
ncbi:restriction endonuclease subunit S [Shewanella sp. SM101]|uniref:restriction endonuclease subunit S n=1 Tax=Shewanella sp. SM101 TaxID=2912789 RepID=UPI0021D7E7C1|nr:restriction endonuclease subunit S [Shewanella sp. SM101]MCU8105375.1 restriction endonuclease subunit S [Shewanella sp. SM101]